MNSFGTFDPYRLAPEPFRDRDMVDAVSGHRVAVGRRVDVLEREADFEIHFEIALRLADEAEIGIVHHDVKIGQLVLRADRQLLDHELEIIVARKGDDVAVGIGGANAERRGQGPAERTRPGRN